MTKVTKRRIMIGAALGLAAVVLVGLSLKPRPVAADFVEVTRGPLAVTLDHEGKTRVRDRFLVSAPVPGRVLRIELDPGDEVAAGETELAIFQPTDPVLLDARSRAEAEARVRAAQSALDQARANRERADAEYDYALKEWKRAQELVEEGVFSAERLDRAESEYKARRKALQAAEAAVRTALHELERAQAALVEPGNPGANGGALIRLRSPISGVVLRVFRESEAVVPAGEPLVEVADPADLEIEADFLSKDAVRIRPGMEARIEQWGGGRSLKGRVRRVEPHGFMKFSALGVEEQRVNVIVDFSGPPEEREGLGDGYRVEVGVVIWSGEDVLQVPTSSLFRRGDDWAVFVVEGGRAALRTVRVGRRNGLAAQVLEGLSEGDEAIAHPSEKIADGVRVEQRS